MIRDRPRGGVVPDGRKQARRAWACPATTRRAPRGGAPSVHPLRTRRRPRRDAGSIAPRHSSPGPHRRRSTSSPSRPRRACRRRARRRACRRPRCQGQARSLPVPPSSTSVRGPPCMGDAAAAEARPPRRRPSVVRPSPPSTKSSSLSPCRTAPAPPSTGRREDRRAPGGRAVGPRRGRPSPPPTSRRPRR